MNSLNMFHEYTSQILDNPHLSEDQQEEKIIQICDLFHFTESHKPSLKIIDFTQDINIIEDNGKRKGIYFCDLKYSTSDPVNRWTYHKNNLNNLKEHLKIEELWFIIVVENFISEDLKLSKAFINSKKVDELYDKIFYFNFSKSTIKILK